MAAQRERPAENGSWWVMTSAFAAASRGWPRGLADKFLCDQYPHHINSERVANLLRQAGSREPWHNPDDCGALALVDLSESSLKQQRQQAQQAINQLQDVLPAIIAQEKHWAAVSQKEFGQHGPDYALADLISLYNLLPRLRPLIDANKQIRAGWHGVAYKLFTYYRDVVDPNCGHSASGPAVRFIQSALDELGIGSREPQAIEKAIERYGRPLRHRKRAKSSGTRPAAVA